MINYVRSENFLEISIVDTSPIVWNKFVVWFALSRPHSIDISTRLSLFQPILHILYLKIGDHVVSTFWLYLGKPYSVRNLQPRIFREYGSYINACIFKILLCARARAQSEVAIHFLDSAKNLSIKDRASLFLNDIEFNVRKCECVSHTFLHCYSWFFVQPKFFCYSQFTPWFTMLQWIEIIATAVSGFDLLYYNLVMKLSN